MKRIILVFLVFITTFLKGQSVDPETFPTLNTGIGNKYLYTNTGGEGKMLVDSVATRSRIYWRNGVNGQDSMGLGGTLVQPTVINMDDKSLVFQNGPFDVMGFYPFGSFSDQWVMLTNVGNHIASVNAYKDTTIGNEGIGCSIDINDAFVTGKEKSFSNYYNVATNNMYSYWHYKNPATSEQIFFNLDDVTGYTIEPFGPGLIGPYAGTSVLLVKNTSGNDIFKISPLGKINVNINAYDDDAAAGTNGLVSGDLYETSATNTLGLPAGVLMKKQ